MTGRWIGGMRQGVCSGCEQVRAVREDGTVVPGRSHAACPGAGKPPAVLLPRAPTPPPARVVRRRRTVLAAIRAAELRLRVPHTLRLEPQPSEGLERHR